MPVKTVGRHALLFIFITVLINMIGFGVIMPVMPQLIMEVTGEDLAHAARWGGILSLAYAVMQFFMMPVMGALSDRYGRRPVILGSLAAYSADFLLLAMAPSVAVLLAARILAGAFAATFSTANAYIADISPPEKRAANFGLMGAAFGLGFIIGPVLGGLVGEKYGPRAPFYLVAVLGVANLAYGYFFLPETLADENRRRFIWRRANTLGSFLHFRQYPVIFPIAAAVLFYQLGHWAFPSVWAYFAEEKFAWSPKEIGLSLMAVGLAAATVQGGLSRKVLPALGERRSAFIGLGIAIPVYLAYALINDGWMIYVLIPLGALGGFTLPALQGIMSRTIPANAQGELQGAIGSINGVSMIFGPVIMTQAFATFSSKGGIYFPGAPFVMASLLALIAMLFLRGAVNRIKRPRGDGPQTEAASGLPADPVAEVSVPR